jgi:hypothetical protein
MKVRTSNKLTFAVSVFLLAGSQVNQVQAADDTYSSQAAPPGYNPSYQNYPPPPPGGWEGVIDSIDGQSERGNAALEQQGTTQSSTQRSGATRPQQPRSTQGYGASRPQQPQGAQSYGAPGYAAPQYNRQPYGGRRDYGRGGSSAPWGGSSGPSFSGPWDSDRGSSSMPWDSGRGGSKMPWDSGRGGSSMPWDSGRGGSKMPWDSGRGGRSMPWGGKKGRGGFMDKDSFADSWDDMLNAPSDMGELPGGLNAPSVSVPNPVDVGDEFDDAARDVPGQMRNVYDDNRRSNTDDRYDRGGYDRYDRGGYDRYRR